MTNKMIKQEELIGTRRHRVGSLFTCYSVERMAVELERALGRLASSS